MKPLTYHIINSAIPGVLFFLGSLLPLLTGEMDFKAICLGAAVGLVASLMLFLNKFYEWFGTQDPCPKLLQFI